MLKFCCINCGTISPKPYEFKACPQGQYCTLIHIDDLLSCPNGTSESQMSSLLNRALQSSQALCVFALRGAFESRVEINEIMFDPSGTNKGHQRGLTMSRD